MLQDELGSKQKIIDDALAAQPSEQQQPAGDGGTGHVHQTKGRGCWLMKCGELVASYKCEFWEECDMLVALYEQDKVIKWIVQSKEVAAKLDS